MTKVTLLMRRDGAKSSGLMTGPGASLLIDLPNVLHGNLLPKYVGLGMFLSCLRIATITSSAPGKHPVIKECGLMTQKT